MAPALFCFFKGSDRAPTPEGLKSAAVVFAVLQLGADD